MKVSFFTFAILLLFSYGSLSCSQLSLSEQQDGRHDSEDNDEVNVPQQVGGAFLVAKCKIDPVIVVEVDEVALGCKLVESADSDKKLDAPPSTAMKFIVKDADGNDVVLSAENASQLRNENGWNWVIRTSKDNLNGEAIEIRPDSATKIGSSSWAGMATQMVDDELVLNETANEKVSRLNKVKRIASEIYEEVKGMLADSIQKLKEAELATSQAEDRYTAKCKAPIEPSFSSTCKTLNSSLADLKENTASIGRYVDELRQLESEAAAKLSKAIKVYDLAVSRLSFW